MYAVVLLVALSGAQEAAGHKGYPTPHHHSHPYPGGYHVLNGGYHWPGYACWGGCGGYASPAYGVPMTPLINPIPPRVYQLAEEERKLDEEIKKREGDKKKGPGKPPIDDDDDTPKPKKKPKDTDDDKASAAITIFLPPGAKLSVDGRPVKATGVKTFATPALERGYDYYYEVTIEVEHDGKPAVEKRRLAIRAGESVHADYRDLGERLAAKR